MDLGGPRSSQADERTRRTAESGGAWRAPVSVRDGLAMSKHYDVAVLGTEIGALAAAALLARRSWRVLVLGQGAKPTTYGYDGVPLARKPSALLAGASPAWTRVLVELAQSQTFRRRVVQ